MWIEADELIASSDSQYRIGKITKGVNLCRKRQLLRKTRGKSSAGVLTRNHTFSLLSSAQYAKHANPGKVGILFHSRYARKVSA